LIGIYAAAVVREVDANDGINNAPPEKGNNGSVIVGTISPLFYAVKTAIIPS
jgi:hypothetical protein